MLNHHAGRFIAQMRHHLTHGLNQVVAYLADESILTVLTASFARAAIAVTARFCSGVRPSCDAFPVIQQSVKVGHPVPGITARAVDIAPGAKSGR